MYVTTLKHLLPDGLMDEWIVMGLMDIDGLMDEWIVMGLMDIDGLMDE